MYTNTAIRVNSYFDYTLQNDLNGPAQLSLLLAPSLTFPNALPPSFFRSCVIAIISSFSRLIHTDFHCKSSGSCTRHFVGFTLTPLNVSTEICCNRANKRYFKFPSTSRLENQSFSYTRRRIFL